MTFFSGVRVLWKLFQSLSRTGIVTDLNNIIEGIFVTIDQISFQVAESKESFPNLYPNSRGMWKTIQDLHSKSLEKFSNIDSNAEEIQKQLDDMSVSSYLAFVLAVFLYKVGDQKLWNPNSPVSDHNIWFSQLLFSPKYVIFPTLFQTWTNIFNATDQATWPFPDPLSCATNLSILKIYRKLYPIEDQKDLSTIPRRWDCTYPQCMQLIKGEFPPRVFDTLMFFAPVSVNPKTKKARLFKNGNLSS